MMNIKGIKLPDHEDFTPDKTITFSNNQFKLANDVKNSTFNLIHDRSVIPNFDVESDLTSHVEENGPNTMMDLQTIQENILLNKSIENPNLNKTVI